MKEGDNRITPTSTSVIIEEIKTIRYQNPISIHLSGMETQGVLENLASEMKNWGQTENNTTLEVSLQPKSLTDLGRSSMKHRCLV